jgi:hypothetical protein
MVVPVGYTDGALESPTDIRPATIMIPPTITVERLFAYLCVIAIPPRRIVVRLFHLLSTFHFPLSTSSPVYPEHACGSLVTPNGGFCL